MKSRFFILFVFLCSWLSAQVSTNPALPLENLPVTVIFDANQGTAGLKDYTGDVYAHTGVITDKSNAPSDWKYVIADWNTNIPKARMTRTAPNLYTLEITPDIRSFYGVPAGETIKQMAFVFRSADRTREGKAAGGKDIFANVYPAGLNVSIVSPQRVNIVERNQPFQVSVSVTVSAAIRLYRNNNLIETASGTSLSTTMVLPDEGNYWLKVTANAGDQVQSDSVFVCVRGEVVQEIRPGGVRSGINYADNSSVILDLFAPQKQYVFVTGDFNNWLPDHNFQMKRDGDHFWLRIGGLTPGQPYVFQYFIDGNIKIADPYTEQTSDPLDQYISSATYPGLVRYPEGKAEGVASVLMTGQKPYSWEVPAFSPPPVDKLIIYEVLLRDFTTGHTSHSATGKLDYLKSLGVNVLELMPVNEFEGNSSWGYNPSFYFAPDKYYGPKNDLKKLVDEAHKRGIAVVIDMVLNHSYRQSPFVGMYWDDASNRPAPNNPWYNPIHNFQNTSAQWGYDFNHESLATQQLVDSINSFWMKEYHVDGFRFDFTKGFSNTIYGPSDWGSAYDMARIANLKRMANEIWKRNPGALVIFEHLAGNTEEMELANAGILLWGNMNGNYTEGAMGYNENGKSNLSWGVFTNRSWSFPNLVTYIESHDEERLLYKCLQYGKSEGSYSTKELTTALKRAELSSVFLLPLPGPKMIWQFGELGYDYSINTCENPQQVSNDCRLSPKPVVWDYEFNENRKNLFETIGRLNYLKVNYEEFSASSSFSGDLYGEVKWYNLSKGSHHVLVVGNFSTSEKSANVSFPVTGTWFDYFSGNEMYVNTALNTLTLPPGKFMFLTTRKMIDPFAETSALHLIMKPVGNFQIFPNPARDLFFLRSDQPVGKIFILNIMGQVVCQDDLKGKTGSVISTGMIPPGIYLVKANIGEKWTSGKLMVQ